MKLPPLLLLILAAPVLAGPAVAPPESLPLPGGEKGIGFDDLTWSPALHRVLAPAGRTGKLDLIDPAVLGTTDVAGFSADADRFAGGHGEGTTSADFGGGRIFASDRSRREVEIVDPGAMKIVGHAKLAGGPDYVRWVEPLTEVWVTEPSRQQIERFAFAHGSLRHAGAIAIPGGPESLVIDAPRGRAYTHTWAGKTVAIDLAKHAVVARWDNGCRGSRGIALDEKRALLFVGCDEGKATALDLAHGGKRVGEVATGKGVDIIAYAPALGHLYVPGGDSATLTIVGVSDGGHLAVLGTVAAAADSHCATVDDARHAYVCDPGHGALLVVTDPFPATN